MVALKNLVVGQAGDFQVVVDEPFGNGRLDRVPLDLGFQLPENRGEALELFRVVGKNIGLVARGLVLVQVPDEEVEVFVEGGLGVGVEGDGGWFAA